MSVLDLDLENFYIEVFCDPELYGVNQIKLRCMVWRRSPEEDFSEEIAFVQTHYREMYQTFLTKMCLVYQKYPERKWDAWDEETEDFLPIVLENIVDVHRNVGNPSIEIVHREGKPMFGFSFGGYACKMSIEHGLCAVYEGDKLFVVDCADFFEILDFWEYSKKLGILAAGNIGDE